MNTMTDTHSIRLASYNIRKCVGLDMRRRPNRILSVINGLEADVVALQEADRRFGNRPSALPARLIEDETDFRVVPLDSNGASLGWHGNAILVRKEMPVSDQTRLELPGTEPRGAVSITINNGVRVTATHLGLRRSDRRRQSAEIVAHLKNGALPSVIIGDMNEWSPTRGLEPLSGSYRLLSPGRSFHAARPIAALDRVALSQLLENTDAGVVDTPKSRMASDHLPIWIDFRLASKTLGVDQKQPQNHEETCAD